MKNTLTAAASVLIILCVCLPAQTATADISSRNDMIINGLKGTLTVDPGIVNLTASPGQTLSLHINVHNGTSQEQTARVTPEDVVAGPQDLPLLALARPAPVHSTLKGWLTGLTPLVLAPGAGQVLNASISVPQNATPGSHLGAIRLLSANAGKNPGSA